MATSMEGRQQLNILITGSEGSLMQATVPYLLNMGHRIIGVDNFFRYGRIDRKRNYEFIEGDLCDPGVVEKACKGADFILQGAARIFGVGGFHKYPADILSRDLQLHQNILLQALKNRVKKVVYISSSMVYERCKAVPSVEEDVDDMQIPFTDYGLMKLVGERLCKAFYKQYGLLYTIWRPFNIITPFERGEDEQGMSHVFADFIRKIVIERQNPVEIFGDGKQIRCFTWIEDVANAIASYSFDKETDCEEFNLGNPEPVTMIELANRIYKKCKEKKIINSNKNLLFKSLPSYSDDVRLRVPCIDKAKKVLRWEPTLTLDEALNECIDAAVDNSEIIPASN